VRVTRLVGRWQQTCVPQLTAGWPALVWRGQRGSSVSGATLAAWRELGHQWQCVALSDVPAYRPPKMYRTSVRINQQPHCQFFRPFSMGTCTKGGEAPNIIPALTTARYIVRAGTLDALEEIRAKVLRCFEAGALATGAQLEIFG